MSVEEAIKGRRSERDFKDQPLNMEQVSQLLWAAQGITEDDGFKRAAPSAGATYPLDVYLVVGEKGVDGLQAGIYHYQVREHALRLLAGGDVRTVLATACVSQMFIADAPIVIVITAEYARTTGRYGERGMRYVHTEVGHVGQNIHLQAEALGLGTVVIGAFIDEEVSGLLHLPKEHEPLYVMPVGYHH
jgi:SagB-type dehydrogenase family enzyme